MAKLFNDSAVYVAFDLRGCISGDDGLCKVDPNTRSTVPRGGAGLKDSYFAIRALFTKGVFSVVRVGSEQPRVGRISRICCTYTERQDKSLCLESALALCFMRSGVALRKRILKC